jgi:hypothetical protein
MLSEWDHETELMVRAVADGHIEDQRALCILRDAMDGLRVKAMRYDAELEPLRQRLNARFADYERRREDSIEVSRRSILSIFSVRASRLSKAARMSLKILTLCAFTTYAKMLAWCDYEGKRQFCYDILLRVWR